MYYIKYIYLPYYAFKKFFQIFKFDIAEKMFYKNQRILYIFTLFININYCKLNYI